MASKAIPILTFHSLDEASSPLSFPPELFRKGMRWLRDQGYQAIPLRQMVSVWESGGALPEKAFVMTFDDGYRSVIEVALPLLSEIGFPATIFINDEGIGEQLPPMCGRPRMSWGQIRELHDAGFEIGSHTLSHADLSKLDRAEIEEELAGARELIQTRLGTAPESFAYPGGHWNPQVREVARRHYRCACTTDLGYAGPGNDLYSLPRIEMHYFRSWRTFSLLASRGIEAYLALRRGPRALRQRVLE